MYWDGKVLGTAGAITDAALDVAQNRPELAPIFLATYASEINKDAVSPGETRVTIALQNLQWMSGYYDTDTTRLFATVFGRSETARKMGTPQ